MRHTMPWVRSTTRVPVSWITTLIVAGLGLLLSPQFALSQEVKLNEVLRSLFYAPQHVAFRIGAFEQEGLKVAGPRQLGASKPR